MTLTSRSASATAAVLLCVLAGAPGCAADDRVLHGRVVWVADGDSFELVDATGERIEVRISGIDAPEQGQAYADASRSSMIRLIRNRDVSVEWYKLDRYDRYVGKVRVRSSAGVCRDVDCPPTLDVAMVQLDAGLAWCFKRFAVELEPEDRARYADAEHRARSRRIGLWRDSSPVPPWEWRDARSQGKRARGN
jgi:endonuclease YncB( thermonuclease family)